MPDPEADGVAERLPRSPRFAIQVPLRYRREGEISWHEGKIENISRSGVLFRCQYLVEPKTAVEMSFVLPVEIGSGESGAEVICHGYIVRTIKSPAPGELPLLAAAILDYRFLRR
jgi:PilZ domain-containing protein